MTVPANLVSCANCLYWDAYNVPELSLITLATVSAAAAANQAAADAANAAASQASIATANAATLAAQTAANSAALAMDPTGQTAAPVVTPVLPVPIVPVSPAPTLGLCRFNPTDFSQVTPSVATIVDNSIVFGGWRTTVCTDWCGQGKAR